MSDAPPNAYELIAALEKDTLAVIAKLENSTRDDHVNHRNLITGLGSRILDVEDKILALRQMVSAQSVEVKGIKERKIEVSNLRITPQMWVATAIFIATVVGGQKWAASSVADALKDTNTQVALIKQHMDDREKLEEARTRLEDERAKNQSDAIAQIRGSVAMVDTKLGNLMINTAAKR